MPAKDEAAHILQALHALNAQKTHEGMPLKPDVFEVLLLANNCTDHTFRLAKEYQDQHDNFPLYIEEVNLPPGADHIGTARRFLMDIAYYRFLFLEHSSQGIIASTDGDSRVDEFWISSILAEMDKGCDVVGGVISTEMEECAAKNLHLTDIVYQNLIARVENLLDPQDHNPWPSHFQCFGANFSITCSMYALAGRLPELPYLEDVAFQKALERKDAKIRKSPLVKVYTSARKKGRVERGLSQQLAYFEELAINDQELWVEPAPSIIARIRLKKNLRELWSDFKGRGNIGADQAPASLKLSQIEAALTSCAYFGEFWETMEKLLMENHWFDQWPPTLVQTAICDLEEEVQSLSSVCHPAPKDGL